MVVQRSLDNRKRVCLGRLGGLDLRPLSGGMLHLPVKHPTCPTSTEAITPQSGALASSTNNWSHTRSHIEENNYLTFTAVCCQERRQQTPSLHALHIPIACSPECDFEESQSRHFICLARIAASEDACDDHGTIPRRYATLQIGTPHLRGVICNGKTAVHILPL
jgi:hypothetical protein